MRLTVPNAVLTFEGQSVELTERQVSHLAKIVTDDLPASGNDIDGHKTVVALGEIAGSMRRWISDRTCRSPISHSHTHRLEKTSALKSVGGRQFTLNLFDVFKEQLGVVADYQADVVAIRVNAITIDFANGNELVIGIATEFEHAVSGHRTRSWNAQGKINDVVYQVSGNADFERGTLAMYGDENILAVDFTVDFVKISNPVTFGALTLDQAEIDYLANDAAARQELMNVIGWKQVLDPTPAAVFVPQADVNQELEFLDIDFTTMSNPRSGTITLDREVRSIALRDINGELVFDVNVIPNQIGHRVTLENGTWLKITIDEHHRTLLHYTCSEGIDRAHLVMDYFEPLQLDYADRHSDSGTASALAVSGVNENRAFDKVLTVSFDDVENSQLGEYPALDGRIDTDRMIRSVALLEMNGETIDSHVMTEVTTGAVSYSIGGLVFTFRPLLDRKGIFYSRSHHCNTARFGINYADWDIRQDQK